MSLGKHCHQGLLMTAKLMSRSVCFEPRAIKDEGFSPAALFPAQFGFGSVRQLNLRGGHYLCSIQRSPSFCFPRVWVKPVPFREGSRPFGPLLLVEGRVDRASDWS